MKVMMTNGEIKKKKHLTFPTLPLAPHSSESGFGCLPPTLRFGLSSPLLQPINHLFLERVVHQKPAPPGTRETIWISKEVLRNELYIL